MQLSIIIVNYNVKFFLEQCLHSVQKAMIGIEAEVIVIDNHSTDQSIGYLKPLFPAVHFIANIENVGFAKANNRALVQARGEYVLFLNPDTLIAENCFQLCLSFLQQNPKAGAIGVRMFNGRGWFLPESKRSFPSIMSSFYKLMGLAVLFPQSRIFNQYALGNLSNNQNQEVGALAGAFFFVKKKIIDDLHGFDEDFFMYGEDIDLSYRIQKAGYQNYYFAGSDIIHFKGESSRKEGLTYVKIFYAAMMVFVQKHYSTGSAKLFSYFIQLAITGRALLTLLNKILKPYILSIIDYIIVWVSFKAVAVFWIFQIRKGKSFGFEYLSASFIFFSILFILLSSFTGMYRKQFKSTQTIFSAIISIVGILAIYSLLPETLRFSRGVILWGGLMGGFLILLLKHFIAYKKSKLFDYEPPRNGKTLVVASEIEFDEIIRLLEKSTPEQQNYSRIAIDKTDKQALCNIVDLGWLEKTIPVSKIIFCAGSLSFIEIIKQIKVFAERDVRLFFHASGSQSIIGSGAYYSTLDSSSPIIQYRIELAYQKRMKRFMDIAISFFFIITFPIHWVFQKKGKDFLKNAYAVLKGNRSWVGYASTSDGLPPITKGIITHLGNIPLLKEDFLRNADVTYAHNFEWWTDVMIVFHNYTILGSPAIKSNADH